MMTVNILAFGIAKEILGGTAISINFSDGVSVLEIKTILEEQYPRLKQLTSFAIAVNGEYTKPETIISPGDEIAIIPPVSGG